MPVSSGVGTSPAATVYPTYVAQLLQEANLPVTNVTQEAMYLWILAEGGVPANNPLNASGTDDGATTCISQCGGSSPVYSYATLEQGISHDAKFLGQSNYTGILTAFRAPNATLQSIWTAINQSPWCKGCTGGLYPKTLFEALSPGYRLTISAAATGSSGAASTGSGCSPVGPNLPVVGQIFTSCSVAKIEGIALMAVGGLVLFVGVALIAAAMGTGRQALRAAEAVPGPTGTLARIGGGQGRQVGAERRSRATRAQAQSDALERTAARGQNTRRNQIKYDETPF